MQDHVFANHRSLSWQWPQLLHHLKISAWVSLSLDRGRLRQRLMDSEPDCVTWWTRPPLCSSMFLIQNDKGNVYLGWKGFWKHVTSSKHSRNNDTRFIRKKLWGWIQKKVPRIWIIGADFGSHARTRNGKMGGPHQQHSEPRSWMASEKQPETRGTGNADIEKSLSRNHSWLVHTLTLTIERREHLWDDSPESRRSSKAFSPTAVRFTLAWWKVNILRISLK